MAFKSYPKKIYLDLITGIADQASKFHNNLSYCKLHPERFAFVGEWYTFKRMKVRDVGTGWNVTTTNFDKTYSKL